MENLAEQVPTDSSLCRVLHLLKEPDVSKLLIVLLIAQPLLMNIPRLYFEQHVSTERLGTFFSVLPPTVVITTFVSCAVISNRTDFGTGKILC